MGRVYLFFYILFSFILITATGRAEESGSSCRQKIKQFIPMMMEVGYSKKDAIAFLVEDLNQRREYLEGIKTQNALHDRISKSAIYSFSRSDALESLPTLLALLPFKLDLKKFLNFVVSDYSVDFNVLKSALRYLDLWNTSEISLDDRKKIIHNLISKSRLQSVSVFYIEKLLRSSLLTPKLAEKIKEGIKYEENQTLPALISSTPYDLIPEPLKERVDAWLSKNQEAPLKLNGINSHEHVDLYTGTCPQMPIGHYGTLGRDKLRRDSMYKNCALIYLKGQLIGSLKLEGDNSIIGLRNIVDDEGRKSFVIGGVYGPNENLVNAAKIAREQTREGRWARIYLNSLDIRPLAFIENEDYEYHDIIKELIAIRKRIERNSK